MSNILNKVLQFIVSSIAYTLSALAIITCIVLYFFFPTLVEVETLGAICLISGLMLVVPSLLNILVQ